MLLKLGSAGAVVAQLINDLRALGFQLPAGATFDDTVRKSVEAFQVTSLDASGNPLVIDGKVGPHTRWALDAVFHGAPPSATTYVLPPLPAGGSPTARAALQVAIAELGKGEVGSDNHGPDVVRYLKGPGGRSWCAGFVSYCLFTAKGGQNGAFGYELGAQAVHNRMRALHHNYPAALSNPPLPGDLIVWRRVDPADPTSAWKGHVGLVYGFVDGNLWTIEGNRGSYPSQVKPFRYSWSDLVQSTGDKFKGVYGLSRHP